MPPTMDEVRARLDPEEVDYLEGAAELGAEALPLLQELAEGADAMLASKAVYLASLISGAGRSSILEVASRHPDAVVRVAAASGLQNLEERETEPQVERLLDDQDPGVRKVTLRSVAAFRSPALAQRIRRLAEDDPEPAIRDLARRRLSD